MKKLSLKTQLLERLQKYGDWVPRGRIEEKSKEWGFLAENGNRRCREMVSGKLSNGKTCPIVLEVRGKGKSVEYRYLKREKLVSIPVEENGIVKIYQQTIWN
jgi:hypothetical protein